MRSKTASGRIVLAISIALATTGCGSAALVAGGSGATSPSGSTTPEPGPEPGAPKMYTVVAGDSLSAIARRQCGSVDRWPSLFNRNAHHDQAKGGALTDPNLIRVGWQLEIDCTEVAPPPVVETAPPPTTTIVAPNGGASPSTTRAPGPLVLNAVPQVLVRLGAQAASPPAGVAASIDLGPADGTSTSVSPLIKGGRPLMVGGVDGPTFEVTHGADLLPEFMGFDDQPPALTLIDGRGESLTLPTAKGGLAMVHVDLGLPQGDYRLEASDGTHRGSIGLRVEDSDGLEIRLQTIDQAHMQLEVVAAQGPLATDWYHLTERGGRKVADYWASGTLVPQQGVGRVEVRRDGADAGAYCSPQVNGFNACRYDGYLLAPAKT